MVDKFKRRVASLISASVFLFFLWVLFKKVIVITWIHMPWWGALITLVVLFVLIDLSVKSALGVGSGDVAADKKRR